MKRRTVFLLIVCGFFLFSVAFLLLNKPQWHNKEIDVEIRKRLVESLTCQNTPGKIRDIISSRMESLRIGGAFHSLTGKLEPGRESITIIMDTENCSFGWCRIHVNASGKAGCRYLFSSYLDNKNLIFPDFSVGYAEYQEECDLYINEFCF